MKLMKCCIQKDCLELIRKKKYLPFWLLVVGMILLTYVSTMFLSKVLDYVMKTAPGFISDAGPIYDVLDVFFPKTVIGNLGIFSSDLMVFYLLFSVFYVFRLLPDERDLGSWILPHENGYTGAMFTVSKALVYSVAAALPVIVGYILYYLLIASVLPDDCGLKNAVFQALLNGLCVFAVTKLTVSFSIVGKHPLVSAISIASLFVLAPDILSLFVFEKRLPFYIFSFVKFVYTDYYDLVIPIILLFVICFAAGITGSISANRKLCYDK